MREADTRVCGPPYVAALGLSSWLLANWGNFESRLILAGHGRGGADVVAGWSVERILNVAYFLLTEGMTAEQRADIDKVLEGPQGQSSRRDRLRAAIQVGGDVVKGRRQQGT